MARTMQRARETRAHGGECEMRRWLAQRPYTNTEQSTAAEAREEMFRACAPRRSEIFACLGREAAERAAVLVVALGECTELEHRVAWVYNHGCTTLQRDKHNKQQRWKGQTGATNRRALRACEGVAATSTLINHRDLVWCACASPRSAMRRRMVVQVALGDGSSGNSSDLLVKFAVDLTRYLDLRYHTLSRESRAPPPATRARASFSAIMVGAAEQQHEGTIAAPSPMPRQHRSAPRAPALDRSLFIVCIVQHHPSSSCIVHRSSSSCIGHPRIITKKRLVRVLGWWEGRSCSSLFLP